MALGFPFKVLLLDAFSTDLRDKFELWPILLTNEVAKGKLGILLDVVKMVGNDWKSSHAIFVSHSRTFKVICPF